MSASIHEWRFEVGRPEHGGRLDGFLQERLSWRSRARLKVAIEQGRVEIEPFKDPQRAEIGRLRPSLRLRAGQEVIVRLPSPRAEVGAVGSKRVAPELETVYRDASMLAINKPPHFSVYPTRAHRGGSLVELVHQKARSEGVSDEQLPRLCHRLDRETSGLVLFALDRAVRVELQKQFEDRSVVKTYLAVLEGELEENSGMIDWPIGRDENSEVEIKQVARPEGPGRKARTEWRVLSRRDGRTLVELRPRTGRQHQLRVHMAALGHPLVGDKLYLGGEQTFLRSIGGEWTEADSEELGLARQALHAWKLNFAHPETGASVEIVAPPWPDLPLSDDWSAD